MPTCGHHSLFLSLSVSHSLSASLYLVSVQEELVLVGLQFKLLLHILLLLGGAGAVVLQRKHNPCAVTLTIQIHAFSGELSNDRQ